MAVKFTSVKCPECGANLPIEEGRKCMFCSYCGAQVIMTNENEHTYRRVDEADVKRAETERLIHLKELELEEKENERHRRGIRTAFTISGGLAVVGAITEIVVPYNLIGIFSILIAMWIALFTLISKDEQHKRKPHRILTPYEVQIAENMDNCRRMNYRAVVALFQSAGFNNIKAIALGDLNILTAKKNNWVESVSINGNDDFEVGDVFQKSDRVIITYHSVK